MKSDRSRFESLETRRLLANISWVGSFNGGDGQSWNNPLNWSTDTVPGPGDHVGIHDSGAGDPVISSHVEIASIFITHGLEIDNGSLITTGDFAVDMAGVQLKNGSLLRVGGETFTADGGISIGSPGDTEPSRLEFFGDFNGFNGEGGIVFSEGSILDTTDVSSPYVSLSRVHFVQATIENNPNTRFSGSDSYFYDLTTTGPIRFGGVKISGDFNLGGSLTFDSTEPKGRIEAFDDVTFHGDVDILFNRTTFFSVQNDVTVTFGPEVSTSFTGYAYFSSGGWWPDTSESASPRIVNQGAMSFGGESVNGNHYFDIEYSFVNEGSLSISDGAQVHLRDLQDNVNELSLTGSQTRAWFDGLYSFNKTANIGLGSSLYLSASSWTLASSMNISGTVIFDHLFDSGATFNALKAQGISGYANNTWTGNGLRNPQAAADARYTLGYATSRAILGPIGGVFNEIDVDSTAVIIHHTLDADFNFDNTVNFYDVLKLAQYYNEPNRNYTDGDTNFDGAVNFIDLLRASQLYGQLLFSTTQIRMKRNDDRLIASLFASTESK